MKALHQMLVAQAVVECGELAASRPCFTVEERRALATQCEAAVLCAALGPLQATQRRFAGQRRACLRRYVSLAIAQEKLHTIISVSNGKYLPRLFLHIKHGSRFLLAYNTRCSAT
jgi:hypothetical protein